MQAIHATSCFRKMNWIILGFATLQLVEMELSTQVVVVLETEKDKSNTPARFSQLHPKFSMNPPATYLR